MWRVAHEAILGRPPRAAAGSDRRRAPRGRGRPALPRLSQHDRPLAATPAHHGSVAARSRPGRAPRIGAAHAAALRPRSPPPPTPPWPSIGRWATEQGAASAWRPCRGPSTVSASRSKKVLHAREWDEEERAAWRTETAYLDPATLVFVDESGNERGDDPALRPGAAGIAGGRGGAAQPRAECHPTCGDERRGYHRGDDHDRGHRRGGLALFVDQILVPSLQPGQVVIWDTRSVHRNQKLRRSIEPPAATSASSALLTGLLPHRQGLRKRRRRAPGGCAGPRRARGRHRGRPGNHHRRGRGRVVRLLWLCLARAPLLRTAVAGSQGDALAGGRPCDCQLLSGSVTRGAPAATAETSPPARTMS